MSSTGYGLSRVNVETMAQADPDEPDAMQRLAAAAKEAGLEIDLTRIRMESEIGRRIAPDLPGYIAATLLDNMEILRASSKFIAEGLVAEKDIRNRVRAHGSITQSCHCMNEIAMTAMKLAELAGARKKVEKKRANAAEIDADVEYVRAVPTEAQEEAEDPDSP